MTGGAGIVLVAEHNGYFLKRSSPATPICVYCEPLMDHFPAELTIHTFEFASKSGPLSRCVQVAVRS